MGHRQSKEPVSVTEYAFLDDPTTVDYIKSSRVLVLLQGHPDIRVRAEKAYEDAKIFTNPNTVLNEVENYLRVTPADNPEMVVVDDPELKTLEQFSQFEKLAVRFRLVQLSPAVLAETVPLFYGWFLNLTDSRDNYRRQGTDLLKEIGGQEGFVQEFSKFAMDAENADQMDITNYFSSEKLTVGDTLLHCTAFFSNFQETDLTKQYFHDHSKSLGKSFYLEVIGFLITPRTFGVRLKLNEDALALWLEDPTQGQECPEDWKPSKYSPTNGPGSRAHLTLGVRGETSAVQTGLDLVEIIKREVADQKSGGEVDRVTLDLDIGTARCYGDGLWAVYLNKSQKLKVLFSNYYTEKKESGTV